MAFLERDRVFAVPPFFCARLRKACLESPVRARMIAGGTCSWVISGARGRLSAPRLAPLPAMVVRQCFGFHWYPVFRVSLYPSTGPANPVEQARSLTLAASFIPTFVTIAHRHAVVSLVDGFDAKARSCGPVSIPPILRGRASRCRSGFEGEIC